MGGILLRSIPPPRRHTGGGWGGGGVPTRGAANITAPNPQGGTEGRQAAPTPSEGYHATFVAEGGQGSSDYLRTPETYKVKV